MTVCEKMTGNQQDRKQCPAVCLGLGLHALEAIEASFFLELPSSHFFAIIIAVYSWKKTEQPAQHTGCTYRFLKVVYLCLSTHHEDEWCSGSKASRILNYDTRWRWLVSVKSGRYKLFRTLSGPQSQWRREQFQNVFILKFRHCLETTKLF